MKILVKKMNVKFYVSNIVARKMYIINLPVTWTSSIRSIGSCSTKGFSMTIYEY